MNDTYILAIETSCDETSASIVKNGSIDISSVVLSQMDIHALFGGVVPEVASRHHIENITLVIEECLTKVDMSMNDIDAIAVTNGPGLVGSLLIGVQVAKTLAYVYNKPLVPVHHIAGHIYANNLVNSMEFPLIALVVSGGHTDLIYMKEDYSFEKIGGTMDDAVGECYDKVARVMKLGYPGGPKVDALATRGYHEYKLPMPLNDDSYNFSFSGLKSAVINLNHKYEQRGEKINVENLATSFQETVTDLLTKKTLRALNEYKVSNLILAGGVAANKGLRNKLEKMAEENNINLSVPDFKYCTDNATMIGAAGYYAYKLGVRADINLNATPTMNLK